MKLLVQLQRITHMMSIITTSQSNTSYVGLDLIFNTLCYSKGIDYNPTQR